LNNSAGHLDGVLSQAAAQAGVNFVDPRAAFVGHGVCGSGGAWINGMSNDSGGGGGFLPIVGSFHPNAKGQIGYTWVFENLITQATSLTSAGFPANPVVATDPPVPASSPTDQIGSLTVTPLVATTSTCEGILQAGQQVNVTGSGFAPGAEVKIYVTSPGLGRTSEVATVTTDSTGSLDGTVRIPLSATGFVEPGATTALVFLDAIGSGQNAPPRRRRSHGRP
jgi:hypothetical protein